MEDQMSLLERCATRDPDSARSLNGVLNWIITRPNAVIALFGLYFIIQTLVRIALPPALRVDEAQQVLFAQWLALGYDAQPPLYNWYQQAIFTVFGTSMATIAVAKNLVLLGIFAVYTKTAELVLKDKRLVAVAVLSLFIIPQVFWQAQRDLTHTAMLMLTFACLLYATIRLIQRPTTLGYLVVGLAAGLGMLSKYNFALILPAVLFAVWLHPNGRDRILDRRFLLTLLIAAVVVFPHTLWLIDNLRFASEVTLKRMAEDAPGNRFLQIGRGIGRIIVGSVIIAALPTALVLLAAHGNKVRNDHNSETPWVRFFLTYFAAIMAIMVAVVLATTMTEVRDRWLLPLLMPFPLLLCLWLENRIGNIGQFVKRFLPIPMALLVVIPLAVLAAPPFMSIIGKKTSSNYNWNGIRAHLVEHEKIAPSVIVTPDWPTGGNMRFLFGQTPVATISYDDYDPTFVWSAEHPILFLWTGNDNKFDHLAEWLKGQLNVDLKDTTITTIEVPMYYPTEGKSVRFQYAVITRDNIR
jgi:4-amino-4-deoxy-L-arabinose transferase-like glycosyltransferase